LDSEKNPSVYCNFCLFVIGPSGKVSRKSNLMDDDDLNDYENDDFFEDEENDETYSTSTDASTDVAEKKPMNQRKVRSVLLEFKSFLFLEKSLLN
jgi:hypothetical protein